MNLRRDLTTHYGTFAAGCPMCVNPTTIHHDDNNALYYEADIGLDQRHVWIPVPATAFTERP